MRPPGRAPPGPLARGAVLAGLLVLLGIGLPQGDLRLLADPARAVLLRQPEALLLSLAGLGLLLLLLLPQAWVEAPHRWLGRARGGRALALGLPLAAAVGGFAEATRDEWRAAGVDWHDSYLCAYALQYDDLVFYAPFRSPLYPALGGALASAAGLPLDRGLQLLSLLALVLVGLALAAVGQRRLGAGAAAAGGLAALSLPTVEVNAHAVTPYPLFAGASALLLWGVVEAGHGRLRGHLLGGLGVAAVFLTDVKGLLPGVVGLGLLLLLLPALRAPRGRWLPRAAAALLLLCAPVGGGYAWMASLPVIPLSLEEHSARVLEDGRAASAQGRGAVFGHFDGPLHPVRALIDVQRALSAPERARAVADRRAASALRLARDYPGLTWRSLALGALGLLLPLRGGGLRGLAGGAAAVVLLLTALGMAGLDYQERYLLHAMPWVVLGLIGGLVAACGAALAAARGQAARPAAGLVGALLLIFVWSWGGSPLRLGAGGAGLGPDPSTGGGQELELWAFAQGGLQPDDLVLDTTWMMSSVLLLGERPVARAPGAYPSFGVPFPEGRWRVSRPWPGPGGRRIALIGLRPAPAHQPRRADTPAGQALLADPDWQDLWSSSRGDLLLRVHTGAEAPTGWLPGGLTGPRAVEGRGTGSGGPGQPAR